MNGPEDVEPEGRGERAAVREARADALAAGAIQGRGPKAGSEGVRCAHKWRAVWVRPLTSSSSNTLRLD